MLVIWLGALFVLGGVVFMMAQPIWRGRLSDASKRTSSGAPRDTLEPRRPGAGFTLKRIGLASDLSCSAAFSY